MGSFSLIHWIILGVIILLLFGGNRFSAMMSDVAKGLKSFKKGLSEEDEERPRDARDGRDAPLEPRALPRHDDRPIDVSPEPRRSGDPAPPASADETTPRH
jgi:sec-independent protein translocase protein TatA